MALDLIHVCFLMKISQQIDNNVDVDFYYKKVKTIQNRFHYIYNGIYLSTLTQVRLIQFTDYIFR